MPTIARHRTAISRTALSRPLQQAHADGVLADNMSVFDYGCGRGGDLRTLHQLGFNAVGWDPGHAASAPKLTADIVNLGYVVNVIEDPTEREDALRGAWALAREALVVSARLTWDPDSSTGHPYGDGRLTASGTFQKYYSPEELKTWVEYVLGETAITAAPGIYYVFRDSRAAQALLARHSRGRARPRQGIAELIYQEQQDLLDPLESYVGQERRLPTAADLVDGPQLIETFGSIRAAFALVRQVTGPAGWTDIDLGTRKRSEARFEQHLDNLQTLIDFLTERGRLPRSGELQNEQDLLAEFGSVRGAYSLVRRVTGPERWLAVEEQAKENYLVFSALSAFGGRPRFSELPSDLQFDAKDLFGSYRAACSAADLLLYSIADTAAIGKACTAAPVGKLTPEALYVHVSALPTVPALLRVYEGAARTLTGNVDDATIVKLHRLKPQVSFLIYPEFDTDPHPALEASVVARLPQLRVSYKNFGGSDNPPILHRKDAFVAPEYPRAGTFARLTRAEEKAELLNSPTIGRRQDWNGHLENSGYRLQGHRLTRRPR